MLKNKTKSSLFICREKMTNNITLSSTCIANKRDCRYLPVMKTSIQIRNRIKDLNNLQEISSLKIFFSPSPIFSCLLQKLFVSLFNHLFANKVKRKKSLFKRELFRGSCLTNSLKDKKNAKTKDKKMLTSTVTDPCVGQSWRSLLEVVWSRDSFSSISMFAINRFNRSVSSSKKCSDSFVSVVPWSISFSSLNSPTPFCSCKGWPCVYLLSNTFFFF